MAASVRYISHVRKRITPIWRRAKLFASPRAFPRLEMQAQSDQLQLRNLELEEELAGS